MHILSPVTDNCPSWISDRERKVVEFFFRTKSLRKNVPDVRTEPATVCLPGRTRIRPSKRARPQSHSKAWNNWGLPPQKHLQISIQVNWDFNRIAKWSEMASHALLVFKISPGVAPGPPYKNRYTGKFWISLLYPTSVPRRHPHPNHHTDAKHVVICWASAYDNL